MDITTIAAAALSSGSPLESIFVQISIAITIAALLSMLMRILKQPLILGYILTGIIVGPSFLDVIHAKEAFNTFSEIGIALLLFIIGLGLNASIIRGLGKISIVTAGVILLAIGSLGHLIGWMLGFDLVTSVMIGIALFFSSTIIILKALSDKHEQGRLYGQIAIGVILVDDVVATIALVAVALMAQGNITVQLFTNLGLKAVILGAMLYVVGVHIVPRIGKMLAKSQELLFIFSIGWGLSVASLFGMAGFSHELGALFAGISLAGLPYAMEMANKLKPLRDFFIVLFFVALGELFTFSAIADSIVPALILSAIVMLGKPILIMATLGFMHYTKLTSFKAGIHLSQISEFSIILLTTASALGVVQDAAVPIITLVALITIALSTYLMQYDDQLYRFFEKRLSMFERKKTREKKKKHKEYPVILFGYHNGGHEFVKTFRQTKQRYLVVDYNPEIIEHMEHRGIRHAYGDVTDSEFLEEIGAAQAELIVSTIDVVEINLSALRFLRRHNPKISYICHASSYEDAEELYKHGASYVSIPHYIGSERVSSFIKRQGHSHDALEEYRNKHLITIGKKSTDVVSSQ